MNKVLLNQCLEIAETAHQGQVDKLGDPYIWHPIAVCQKMPTDIYKCVALLHDVLEDSYFTPNILLKRGIPKSIVDRVVILTKGPKEKYMSYIKRVKQDPITTKVKIADLEHNLDPSRQLSDEYAEKRREKYRKALKYLQK